MTPMMYSLAAIAVLVAALGGTGWLLRQSYQANGHLTGRIQGLEASLAASERQKKVDRVVLNAVSKAKAEDSFAAAVAQQKVDKAAGNHRDWAVMPVPQDVQDAIFKP